MLNAVAQRPYEHSPWRCLRGCRGFHITWIKVMIIHISTTGSSTSTCDRRAVEQPVCEDDKIYVQHQLCVSGRQALCASRWLMTGLHCGTIVHIIGDEQRTYLVVKGTGRNRELRLSRAMVDMGTLKYWCCATQNFCTHSQQRRVTLQEIILCTSLPRPRFQYANPLLFSRPLENGNKKQYSMSYYQLRVLLLFFTLIIVNNIAPPPPTRDFNNNTCDCNEESGRSAANYK